jgi:hypothetical protein
VPRTVHVFSGDAAATRWRDGGGADDVLVWREALNAGPLGAPPGTRQWLDERAAFLAAEAGVAVDACRRDLARQQDGLAAAMDADEVVLWFARDLFCELGMVYVLATIAAGGRRPRRLGLVQPADSGTRGFPCFGVLEPAALIRLADGRRDVTAAELAAAPGVWEALAAPSPDRLDALASASGPFAGALRKQRARFPALGDGLGATERVALAALGDGPAPIGAVLAAVGAALPEYGWTGLQVGSELAALATGPRPLVARAGAGFSITPDGRAVLAGRSDRARLCPPDGWIGGVRVGPGRLWQWDTAHGRLVPPA